MNHSGVESGAAAAGVEQRLDERRSDRPKAARPVQPVENRASFEPGRCAERHSGEERRARDAYLLARFLDSTLRRGDVRPPFKEL